MSVVAIGAGVGALAGVASSMYGASQMRKAAELAKENQRPTEVVPDSINQNAKLLEVYANNGMPAEQYNQAKQNIARNQNATIQASSDNRGGLMVLPQVQQQSNDAVLNLDVANATARRQAQQQQIQQNNVLGTWQDKVWGWNKQQKYLEQAAAARAMLGAGQANLWSGIDRTVGSGLKLAGTIGGGSGKIGGDIEVGEPNPYAAFGEDSPSNAFLGYDT